MRYNEDTNIYIHIQHMYIYIMFTIWQLVNKDLTGRHQEDGGQDWSRPHVATEPWNEGNCRGNYLKTNLIYLISGQWTIVMYPDLPKESMPKQENPVLNSSFTRNVLYINVRTNKRSPNLRESVWQFRSNPVRTWKRSPISKSTYANYYFVVKRVIQLGVIFISMRILCIHTHIYIYIILYIHILYYILYYIILHYITLYYTIL